MKRLAVETGTQRRWPRQGQVRRPALLFSCMYVWRAFKVPLLAIQLGLRTDSRGPNTTPQGPHQMQQRITFTMYRWMLPITVGPGSRHRVGARQSRVSPRGSNVPPRPPTPPRPPPRPPLRRRGATSAGPASDLATVVAMGFELRQPRRGERSLN